MISRFFWLISLLAIPAVSHAFADEEPLEPDQAFGLHAFAVDANTVRAEWTIADGYYLYRDKFKFSTDAAVTLGQPVTPPGKVKKDEFFGDVETYRHKVSVDIPVTRQAGAPDTFVLKAVSQGCADMGICYPPHTQTAKIDMPPLKSPAAESKPSVSILDKIGKKMGLLGGEDTFLPPEEAFVFSAEAVDGNTLRAKWDVADGYYLYRQHFAFSLKDANGVVLGNPVFPKGKEKVDEAFGRMEVYPHAVAVDLPVNRTKLDATEVVLEARYQGCAEAGFCYPPMTKTISLALPAGAASAPAPTAPAVGATSAGFVSEQDSIAQSLANSNLLLVIASFFGFGLLLAFTPCVFPMVPILSSIIVGQGEGLTTRKAFTMSLTYVLAMAVTYTIAGVIAGLFGQNLQATFQNPWVLSVFSAVFVLLSLSMFGFYDLQLPNSWQSKLTELSNRQQGGTLTGVAIMGLLSALIVGPCVAAPLAGALIYIGQTGDAVLGGIALFALSLGMGAPLLVIGTSAGKLLPRAGDWMNPIKAVFGVMLLAVAIWMLERIVPAQAAMVMWAALLIISSVYMGALDRLGPDASGWRKLWKGSGFAMLVYGALLLVGVAGGGTDALQPLRGVGFAGGAGGSIASAATSESMHFKTIKGISGLERELAAASRAGKPVMLDFYADWCVSCKEMEKYTFSDPAVQKALAGGVLLQADVTANDDEDKALLKRFRLIGPPSMIFFGPDGQERREYRLVGFLEAAQFSQHVKKAFGI